MLIFVCLIVWFVWFDLCLFLFSLLALPSASLCFWSKDVDFLILFCLLCPHVETVTVG